MLRLHLECLEPRLAMAGLPVATFAGGVLSISGTSDADTITLNYDATQVTLVELNQSFVIKSLAAIKFSLGAGDDIVQLNYTGPKKTKDLNVAMTLRAQGGNDQFIDAFDDIYFLGGDDVLTISRKQAMRLDGQKLSWFDTNLSDYQLRNAAEAKFSDKVLSRADMLTVFDTAAADEIVSSAEFTSLQKIAEKSSLFRKLEDVFTLTGYVVLGTNANQFYQQQTLGNLTVGSSGEQLEQLVNKWFLGLDRPDSHDHETGELYEYRPAAGTLFVNGINYSDVRQGALGDCYLLAGLAAIAVHSPKPVAEMITDNGDRTYTVRFFNGDTPYYITVDRQLPVDQWGRLAYAGVGSQYNDPGNELWAPLIEKAYAQLAEFGWLDTGGDAENSYSAINAGWPGDVTGQATGETVIDLLALENPTNVIKAFVSHRAVTFITPNEPASPAIIGDHVYAMVGYNAQTREFLLFNPWGIDNGVVPGLVSFTWEELQQNAYAWDYGPRV